MSPLTILRALSSLCLAGACASWASLARAEATTSLHWTKLAGAESCVSEDALSKAVETRLGRRAFVPAKDAKVAIEGDIGPREGGGFRATLTMRGAKGAVLGVRELAHEGAACSAFDEELTLVLALMIDADASPAKSAPAPTALVPKAAEPPPRSPLRAQLEVGAAAAEALLPGVDEGVVARAFAHLTDRFSVVARGTFWGSRTTEDASGKGSSFRLFEGGGGVCAKVLPRRSFALFGCAGLSFGSLVADGVGLDRRGRVSKLVVRADARVEATFALGGPFLLFASAGPVVPFQEDTYFYVDGGGARHDVFRVPPVAVTEDAGLGVVFP